jgi:diguanylate cyclase (GGDEF)-like protein
VLFVDLDNFKYVNDSWGHDVGDRLLVSVAERLAAVLRPPDIVARLGGDEFVALLEDVGIEEEAIRVAERIAEALRAPFDLDGYEAFVTASVGVALGGPGAVGPEGAVDLLRRADLAMYEAKEGGKARHAVFDPAAERRTVRRLGLETGLRRALERDELVVHYQPVVSLSTGEIAGFEALVRWERPGRGLVAPSEFVPLAEETGLIVPIGRRVLEEACGRAKEWQDRYPKDPPLVVWANLSARQLKHPGLAGEVAAALEKTGLAPDTLTLEMTESALVGDTEAVLGALHEIRDLGARFALDDFGTGYSSLSYLKRLPVGLLKLDGSFVGGIGGTDLEEDEVLLSGVVGIAHGLGLRVCAEGVETPEQLSRVRALGCDLAQGFLFSRPLPAEAASELLAKNPRWR